MGSSTITASYRAKSGNTTLSVTAPAASGSLDTTFGTGGMVMTSIGIGSIYINHVAILTNGTVVAAGYTQNGTNRDFALVRSNADGSLDTSFGTGGLATTHIGTGGQVLDVAIQSDGKIVAAGSAFNSAYVFGLARYNTDGSLDTTFGTGGMVMTSITGYSMCHSVVIQTDGKIVAAGWSYDGAKNDFTLTRYNTDGSLDTAFGTGGKVTTGFPTNSKAMSITIQPDGKIVAGGSSVIGSTEEFALARYNTNGALDITFGAGGKVITPIGAHNDFVRSVVLQSDGKIIAAGSSMNVASNDYSFALARYNTDGTLDSTFDTDGKVTTNYGAREDEVESVAIQSDGKIVAAGYAWNGTGYDFGVARYTVDGLLDTTFGTGGKVTTDFGTIGDHSYSIVFSSNGKITVAGTSRNAANSDDIAIARYNP